MTWSEWEKRFFKSLNELSDDERLELAAYYREMYGDKMDAGLSEAEILAEFGDPELCARKILADNAEDAEKAEKPTPAPVETVSGPVTLPPVPVIAEEKTQTKNAGRQVSVASVIGTVFLTLLLILPLSVAALGVIASFGASCISGGVAAIAGFVYILLVPFSGMTGSGVVAHIGIGIAAIGLGTLTLVGFWYLTKYTAIGTFKALVFVYGGKKK